MKKDYQILGISGSPRQGGNTDIMVNQVLESAREEGARTEFVKIADLKIAPCDACWSCAETSECHIKDDMEKLYPLLLKANGIIIGSPVHMGYNVSGQTQVFFDRTFPFWHKKMLRNKVGAGLAAANRRGTINAIGVINSFFFNHHMIVAGFVSGYGQNPGDVRNDKRALPEATILGKRLIELIEKTK